MRKLFLILIILTSFNSISQIRKEIFFYDFVECFYPQKETEPIIIYSKPNGKKISELNPLENNHCWYKFAISKSKKGWLKIENVIVLPGCEKNELNKNVGKYKGKWILEGKMEIFLPDSDSVLMNFYEKPDKESKVVFTASDYLSTKLIGVSGKWAKLKFNYKGKEIIGWLEEKYQCSYPWTNCPVWD